MTKLNKILKGFSVLLLMFATFIFSNGILNAQNLESNIKGKIIDREDKSPVSNATIIIKTLNNSNDKGYSLKSDEDGKFSLKVDSLIPPVRIIITHQTYKRRELVLGNPNKGSLTIGLRKAVEEVFLNGRVIRSTDKNPVESATIKLLLINNVDVPASVTAMTTADGSFKLGFEVNTNDTNELILSVNHPDYLTFKSRLKFESGKEYVIKIQPQSHYIRLAGKVTDKTNGNPIEFASIQVLPGDKKASLEKKIGTSTDVNGIFEFTFRFSVPFRLKFSHISYRTEEILVNDPTFKRIKVEMLPEAISGEEIYVISNIVSDDELKNIGTVDKVSNVEIQEIASLSVFDLVSTLREVDVSTQSLNLQSVSTRGFNSTANSRFLQLTNGIDNEAPGLGFPLGNLLGPSDLDIASIELLAGPSTTQYGSSALSGVLVTNSKDPFISEGVDLGVKAGLHNFEFGGSDPWAIEGEEIYDLSLRYAEVLFDKLAVKVTGTMTSGTDWRANNYDNLGPRESWMGRNEDPGYDGVNIYGDENYTFLPVGFDVQGNPNGSLTPVTRTGYKEIDLVDYDISTKKIAGSLHYKFQERTKLSVEGRYGYTNTLYTSDSRIRLENFEMYQLKSESSISNFLVRGYTTLQNSGDSYNVNILSSQLITGAKSNANWYRDFEIAYEQGLPVYNIRPKNLQDARRFADSGVTLLFDQDANPRLKPGTPEFDAELERLKAIAGFDDGAGIRDNSQLYHIEANNKFNNAFNVADLTIGGSFRFYDVDSRGTIFPDTVGNDITNYKYGTFIQADKRFFDGDLNTIVSIRLAKSENFDFKLSQQVGLNYNFKEKHYFRFSYQNGFRYPILREQFLNTNLGKGRLIGGLAHISNSYDLQQNSFTEQAVNDFNNAVIEDLNSRSNNYQRSQAELLNLFILEQGILGENDLNSIKPETTHSFEVGYRQLVNTRLYVDLNYFISFYNNFIGIKRVVKPRTSPSIDLYTAAGQINNVNENDRYFVYNNAESNVTAQGVSFDIAYTSGNFMSSLNGTWSKLFKTPNDPIIPGYNTPPFKVNFEWGNREIITNVGFKMTFRARSSYNWQSSFLDGKIPGYGHFDFQFNIRIPSLRSKIKTGVTNMGVRPYYDTFGGPAVGSILFATFTFSPGAYK